MGALLVASGQEPVSILAERVRAMAARSPYRGALRLAGSLPKGLALAVQARTTDASLVETPSLTVAVHGRAFHATAEGPKSLGDSSAETVAALWRQRGYRAFEHLDGEYTIAVYDRESDALYVCRSLMMTKPLYTVSGAEGLVLATDIRQCLAGSDREPRLDHAQIAQGFWVGGPILERWRTEYEGVDRLLSPVIYRLRPGATRLTEIGQYWQAPEICTRPDQAQDGDPIERTLRCLAGAVSALDGEVGLSLSAGHDSGTIWAVSKHSPPRGGAPRYYSLTWPGAEDDQQPFVKAMLAAHGEEACFVDASAWRASDFVAEHVETLDRIPHTTTFNANPLARQMRADGVEQHLTGVGGEAALMVLPTYMADLLRSGQILSLAQDLLRFHPYLLRHQSLRRRLRFLLPQVLAPSGSLLRRMRRKDPLEGIGRTWRTLCMDALQLWDRSSRTPGYWRGGKLLFVRYNAIIGGLETIDQLFESHGLENVAPFMYKSVINVTLGTSARDLCRGSYDKQAHRDVAAMALGSAPAWPRYKQSAAPVFERDPSVVTSLGPPKSWRLIELDILDEGYAATMENPQVRPTTAVGQSLASGYFERYLRQYR